MKEIFQSLSDQEITDYTKKGKLNAAQCAYAYYMCLTNKKESGTCQWVYSACGRYGYKPPKNPPCGTCTCN